MNTRPHRKAAISLSVALITFLWIFGAQELYVNSVVLSNANALRYAGYFFWLSLVGIIGFVTLRHYRLREMSLLWAGMYALVLIILFFLGIIDLFIVSFSRSEKNYVQTFRLFFQSPAPLVIFYLVTTLGNKSAVQKVPAP